MKTLGLLLLGLFCSRIHAATSEHLFPTGGDTFNGTAGNIVFSGQRFVTPVVLSNGAIQLTFIDTNGVAISNLSLSLTGSNPRLVPNGIGYLLAWLNTNVTPSEVKCARVSGGVIGAIATVATNGADETLSLSGTSAPFLAVWQSAGSNTAVFARTLDSNGAPLAPDFAVAPSVQAQLYPSVGTEHTNHLVCWVEKDGVSNDWKTVARLISNGLPTGTAVTVSQTNSSLPHPTGCSFGTNYLVAWSLDEMGGPFDPWWPTIQGRMVSPAGLPLRNAFLVARNIELNVNPAIASGADDFVVAWATMTGNQFNQYQALQRIQRLSADGSRRGYPVHGVRIPSKSRNQPRIGFGLGRFCVLYPHVLGPGSAERTSSIVFGADQMAEPALVNLRRTTNGGIVVDNSSPTAVIEVSTNLVNWTPSFLAQLPLLSGLSRLFVRSFDRRWNCIEQLRSLGWAKQEWAFENKRINSDRPTDVDLFGSTRYLADKPHCPHNGTYTLGPVEAKPTCTLPGHTL